MAKLIGTAGHVDHGKTSLIKALTGIDADRLPEEKDRGLTIDIGFAYIELPEVGRVSIVDVPGHERFLANMLVGALGIDVALLCVAADESVKPQTREHFEILTLLPVEKLVVALTRADLADGDTLELSQIEIQELVKGTRFENSAIIPVSVVSGSGLDDLRAALGAALQGPEPDAGDPWYLPVDRVFSVKGHGTVVTGTLMQGVVAEGDDVEIQPGSLRGRIRQIQGHDSTRSTSEKGQRTALNLSGVRQEDLHRGMLAGRPGTVFESSVVDADVRWIREPKHGARVRVSVGADEVVGKVFFGDHEVAQLRFERPTATTVGQPLIVRRYSPPDVLGGGRVIVPQAVARKRREGVLQVKADTVEGRLLEIIAGSPGGIATEEACRVLGRSQQDLGEVFEKLIRQDEVVGFAGLWLVPAKFKMAVEQVRSVLTRLHDQDPTQLLFPRDNVVREAGLSWQGKPLDRIVSHLVEAGVLHARGAEIGLAERAAKLNPNQRALLDRVVRALTEAGVNVPSPAEVARELNVPVQAVNGILGIGSQAGEVVRLTEGLWYSRKQIEAIVAQARHALGFQSFTASDFRNAVHTSRKYAIPLLEHLDARRITLRQGDNRVFVQKS